ncbi:MAG: hypothetical protein OHK0028_09330 [Deltaproteobacteria bacterium]
MGGWIGNRWGTFAPQIHDKIQAADFAGKWGTGTEIAFLRFEVGTHNGETHLFVDALLYHPHENQVFVLLASKVEKDGRVRFPDLVRGWPAAVLDQIAGSILGQISSSPPKNFDIRAVHRSSVPFDVESLTIERVLPGVRDYCTAVNHIKRYRFVRDHVLPGKVIDCACGTGYGASMTMHRRDVSRYVGVDLSEFAVAFSGKLVRDDRCLFVNRALAEVEEAGFENVVSLETIEHTPDPHAFLDDLVAKMAPEGQLILSLPAERWGGSHRNPYHLTNWTYARFERMLSSRFEDVKIRKQRLSLLGPDTFGASDIYDRPCDEREDECFVALLRGPKPGKRRRIVVRRRFAIGDTIWATPIVSAVKERHPDCDIVVATDVTQVFLRNPDADIVATTAFSAREDDRVIDLDGSYESDRASHILEAYRKAAGFPITGNRPSLYPGEEDYLVVDGILRKTFWRDPEVEWIVSIHMAASSPDRVWPAPHWRAFLENLIGCNRVGVICVGGPKDFDPAALDLPPEMLRRIVSVRNADRFLVSAAAISVSDLFVGPDSGMSHVAAAFGTRSVVLYGMTNPRTRIPFDGSSAAIWADVECRGCLDEIPRDQPPLCKFGKAYCLDRIDPSLVLEKVNGILETIPGRTWERRMCLHSVDPPPGVPRVLPPASHADAEPPESAGKGRKHRVAVYSFDAPERACADLRLLAPLKRLEGNVEFRWGITKSGNGLRIDPEAIQRADLVVLQRFFPMRQTWSFIDAVLRSGIPVVYDTDDLLTHVPPGNPNREFAVACAPFIERTMRSCAAITVSTTDLAKEILPYHPKVFVLPNFIDEEIWSGVRSGVPERQGTGRKGLTIIGYAGTPTHGADLERVEEALEIIAARHAGRVGFLFMGCVTDRMKRLPGVSLMGFQPSYREYAKALRGAGIDIAVAPLEDNRFNRCKSNIKWLEYGACGIPGVYQDLPPYNASVSHGKTGFLAGDRTQDWVDALDRLIGRPEERFRIGNAARTEILEKYTLAARGSLYIETWRKILEGHVRRGREGAGKPARAAVADYGSPDSPASGMPVRSTAGAGEDAARSGKPGAAGSATLVEGRKYPASIVIPLFNKVEYTRKCVESLSRTVDSAGPVEIVLVDNGSTDGTREFLDSLGGDVVIVRNAENLGFAVACNQGARVSRGRNIVFLNNDTVPQPGWLEALFAASKEEGADICGARLVYPDGRIQHAGVAFNAEGVGYHIFNGLPKDHPAVTKRRCFQAVTAACMLVRRELLDELGGFDEGYRNGFEDVDFCLRAGGKGHRILYVPECVVVHHEETSEGRKAHDRENLERFLARWKGKVLPDDERFYGEEGFRKHRNPDGTGWTILPAEDAIGRLRDVLDADPVNVVALFELVKAANESNRLGEAVRYLSAYLQYKPSDPHILFSLAGVLFRNGKREEALDALDRLAFFDPSYDGANALRERIASSAQPV